MVHGTFHKIKCYSVPDSEESSEIEDIAFGSESEDHWEELSNIDMHEEVETEEVTEPDEVDMSV
jgi:hypothetical protein